MWVIIGPFDADVPGELAFEKQKLLKPSKTYSLGRKGQNLIVNSKKISGHHCDFIVGEHTVDHVGDHTVIPTLEILNTNAKDKTYSITRREDFIGAGQNEKVVLESGDSIALITGILVRVEWRPICIFQPPSRGKSSVSSATLNGCASLGIKLSQKMHENVTHHLASHYVANLTMIASLLNMTRIVKPEWLSEILRLGALDKEDENATGTSLEERLALPVETKYRPAFSPSLLPKQKTFDVWEPNEERVNLLKPFRFICMQEKATELDAEIREAIDRGGGSYETFKVSDGVEKLPRVLARSRAKEGKKTIVVGDIDSLQTAVGASTWKEFVSEARSYSTDIFAPSKIVQAVIEINTSVLEVPTEDSAPRSSPLPDNVPNSIPEEPTMQPDELPNRKRRSDAVVDENSERPGKRLAPVAAFSPEPVERSSKRLKPVSSPLPPEPVEPPATEVKPFASRGRLGMSRETTAELEAPSPPRKIPRIPIDLDDSFTPDSDIGASSKKRKLGFAGLLDTDQDAEAKRHERMRKRAEAAAAAAAAASATAQTDSAWPAIPPTQQPEEPPLKKFRPLFESTAKDPEELERFKRSLADPNMDVQAIVNGTQSQTQTQAGETQGSRRNAAGRTMGVSTMEILREEDEEDTQGGQTAPGERGPRGAKRARLDSMEESGAGMEEAGMVRSRSRAVSNASVGSTTGASAAKRRAVENVNAVQRTAESEPPAGPSKKPISTTFEAFDSREAKNKAKEQEKEAEKAKCKQASSSKVDTDQPFLTAIASRKRGKKAENLDQFDKDFNNLQIVKPKLDSDRRDPEEEWALLKEFGDDSDVRGNFMIIVDLEVYKKDEAAIEAQRQKSWNPAWDGRPNFKKFKQKAPRAPREKIELFATQDKEPTVDPSYWKVKKSKNMEGYTESQSYNNDMDMGSQMDSQPMPTATTALSQSMYDFGDEETQETGTVNIRRTSRKPPSTAESVASTSRSKKPTSSSSKAKVAAKKKNALFLDSDDDIQEVDENVLDVPPKSSRARSSRYTQAEEPDSDFDVDQTLQTQSELKPKVKGKAKAPAGGTKRAAATRGAAGKGRSKAAPIVVDEDSDDAVFKGFGR
uniref:FHA domain-containing protein n=1 Tax=Psilocybe cubensis TaxID=181762 RepID=A0A8H8CF78_PSICU